MKNFSIKDGKMSEKQKVIQVKGDHGQGDKLLQAKKKKLTVM